MAEKCRVLGCKRDAEHVWEPWKSTPEKPIRVPVCGYHFRRDLWWYKGGVWDRGE